MENKFKVGDWVRRINNGDSRSPLPIGSVWEVESIFTDEDIVIKDDPRGYGITNSKYFELADDYILKQLWHDSCGSSDEES